MNTKHLLLIALALISLLTGATGQYFYPGYEIPQSDLWFLPIIVFLIFWWYRLDSMEHAYKRSPWLNFGVIAITILALPYYFLRSRSVKSGFFAIALFLIAIVTFGFLMWAGECAVYYGLQS